MMENLSRRELFSRKFLNNLWSTFSGETESSKERFFAEYFQSSLYSYPTLQELPWELTLEEAHKNGISTDGRTRNDIVRDLYVKILENDSSERR